MVRVAMIIWKGRDPLHCIKPNLTKWKNLPTTNFCIMIKLQTSNFFRKQISCISLYFLASSEHNTCMLVKGHNAQWSGFYHIRITGKSLITKPTNLKFQEPTKKLIHQSWYSFVQPISNGIFRTQKLHFSEPDSLLIPLHC